MNNTLIVCFMGVKMGVKTCWDYLVNVVIGEIEEKQWKLSHYNWLFSNFRLSSDV